VPSDHPELPVGTVGRVAGAQPGFVAPGWGEVIEQATRSLPGIGIAFLGPSGRMTDAKHIKALAWMSQNKHVIARDPPFNRRCIPLFEGVTGSWSLPAGSTYPLPIGRMLRSIPRAKQFRSTAGRQEVCPAGRGKCSAVYPEPEHRNQDSFL
jgi:hypothetical protein